MAGTKKMKKWYVFAAVALICLGAWLRTYQLDTHLILFGDAGRDLLVAHTSLESKSLPLLGIPSSIPRFKQGPLTIWFEMAVLAVFGNNVIAVGLAFAVLSCIALISLYELVVVELGGKAAVVATAIMAMSPLAVAHARMPYHITPIPFFLLLYFYGLLRYAKKTSLQNLFFAVLSFFLLFQFELNLVPVSLLLPYVWLKVWGRRIPNTREVATVLVATLSGLAPQLIHDVTHSFEQVGVFVGWLGYRLVGAAIPGGGHQFSLDQIWTVAQLFWLYGSRIFTIFDSSLAVVGIVMVVLTLFLATVKTVKTKSPLLVQLTVFSHWLLVFAYVVHGAPSEAYFPPFIVLWAILLGYGASLLKKEAYCLVLGILIWWIVQVVPQFQQNNWFVDSSSEFSYGASVYQQQQIVRYLQALQQPITLKTTTDGGVFPAYFDNLRWLATTNESSTFKEDISGSIVVIDPLTVQTMRFYPSVYCREFETQVVCQVQ